MRYSLGFALLWAALPCLPPGSAGDIEIAYSIEADARVSLAVYDKDGVQVRTLLSAEPQSRGRHSAAWDGLDRDGKPVPPGEYTWKMIQSQGLKAEYLLSLGTSVGTDHWPCQHGGPKAVAVDGDGFIMGGTSEGSPVLSKASFEGKILWHRAGFPAPEGLVDMAADGDRLYALMSSCALERLNPKTGASLQKPGGKGHYRFKLWHPFRDLGRIEPTGDQDKSGKPARLLSFDVPEGHYLVRFKARLTPECGGAVLHCHVNDKWFSFRDSGLKAGGSTEVIAPLAYGNHEPIHVRDGKLSIQFHFEKSPPEGKWAVDEMELLAPAERVDARDGAVAVLFPGAGTAGWVDPETGALTAKASVPGARDVALAGKDELLCAAGDRILRVRRDALKAEPVAAGLVDAERLCFDPVKRRFLVFCGGERRQVLAFGQDFKPQAELGRRGGRTTGLYTAEDFLAVSDIAADGRGGFVITEADSAPRRTAWFDGQGGLQKEWFGGQQFYTFAVPDPDDPAIVWMDSQWGWLMQATVDYQKRTWKPRACYRWAERLDPFMFPTGKMTVRFFPFHADLAGGGRPRPYLWFQNGGLILRVDEAAGILHPVAHLGRMLPNQSWEWHRVPLEKYPAAFKEALAAQKADPANREHAKGFLGFGWADANDDGQVQAGALRLLPPSIHKNGHGFHGHGSVQWLDPASMNMIVFAESSKAAYHIRPPAGRTPQGYPIWEWQGDFNGKLQAGPQAPYPFTGSRGARIDKTGHVYLLMIGGGDDYASGLDSFHSHGAGWPGTLTSRGNVAKFAPDGRLLWVAGNKASQADALRGQVHHPVHVAGFAKGAVGVCDYFRVPCHFWTEDGLFIGTLLDGRVQDGLPDRLYSWWRADPSKGDEYDNLAAFQYDMLVGGSLVELPSGEVVFLGAGWNNVRCFKGHGLDKAIRQQGTVKLAAPAAGAAGQGTGLKGEYFNEAGFTGAPAFQQTDARIWFGGSDKHKWTPHEATRKPFAARWTGTIEPRFSEEYRFALYAVGKARLWIGGRLAADNARLGGDDGNRQQALGNHGWKEFTSPLRLQAGRKVPIRVEWEGPADKGEVHLCWESASQSIEHVPADFLHPTVPAGLPVVRLTASRPRTFRPGTGKAEPADFIALRDGDTGRALTVGIDWKGSARPGEDYAALPAQVSFPAGAKEVRLRVEPKGTSGIGPTREVIGVPRPGEGCLMDGSEGTATVAIADGRAVQLEVADIRATSSWNAPWGKMDLHEKDLRRLVDGSGLDRSIDPPTHSPKIETQWFAECAEADRTEIVFDLGAACDLADVHLWNANATSRHGGGWGDGNSVRHAFRKLQVLASEKADGPWKDAGTFRLKRPSGRADEAGERLSLGIRARYVRFRSLQRTEMHCIGLSEVEFLGAKAP